MTYNSSLFSLTSFLRCTLCPRRCRANRLAGAIGYCRSDSGFAIAAITLHRGEEPVLGGERGICNVFFSRCNLSCSYCQNYQISHAGSFLQQRSWQLDEVVGEIARHLETGVTHLGFVSPTHMLPQMAAIIEGVKKAGFNPIIVYNSNGYDRVESLRELEDLVDIYLPDCKYMENALAAEFSEAADYPEVARAALREMYRQKGALIHLDDAGLAQRGMIVRHLVLPGQVPNSSKVLHFLAEELSPRLTISLMSQYLPTAAVAQHPTLHRTIFPEEYMQVVTLLEQLGFENGWVQDYSSARYYSPDFRKEQPFAG